MIKTLIRLILLVSLNSGAGINISGSSDSSHIDKTKGHMVLDGNVKISFDKGIIDADHVNIRRAGDIIKLHAKGTNNKLVIFKINGVSGEARVLDYNEKTGVLVLVGEAKLDDGDNKISGKNIRYNTK